MQDFQDFTNLYSLSKTLRFELIPTKETLSNIESKGFLSNDKKRAEDYKKVKSIIDEYHKQYIENRLERFELQYENRGKQDSLQEYYDSIKTSNNDATEKIQNALRKQISKHLKSTEQYKRLDKKELIDQDLPNFVRNEADKKLIESFSSFTTYFVGFHQNRQNMYSDEAKSTAIAYRLIHENLPKFIDNIEIFNSVKQIPEIAENIEQLYEDFKTDLTVRQISEVFELAYFNSVLTQKQITLYNTIVGGYRDECDIKVKGLNEYINAYNQTHKGERLPLFKVLYKQILSDRESLSWLPEQFGSDNDLLLAINEYYTSVTEPINNLRALLESISTYDLSGVFLSNDVGLTTISKRVYGDWRVIQQAITEALKQNVKRKKKKDIELYEDEEWLTKLYEREGSYSIGYINDITRSRIESYFADLDVADENQENVFTRISKAYAEVSTLLVNPYPEDQRLHQNKDDVEAIKRFLDSLMDLLHFVKPLLGTGEEADKDHRFYGEFLPIWEQLSLLTPLYDKVRNYVTRKPYSTEKVKINFDSSQLLGGWDKNKERACLSVILRKGGKYYLGVMDKHNNKVLDNYPCDGECYEKMEYKLLPGANKMLPKVFFSKSRIDEFCPSNEILRIYESGSFKKGVNFNLKDCHKLINFYKESIAKHEDWSKFEFNFASTESYEDVSNFYREVENQGYKITFRPISVTYIDSLVESGKLYLFQIYNKDFSEYSKGTPNLHTLYWKMLFDERNLADVVYQLNGGAEIFYRERSIENAKPTHPAGVPIANKNILNPKRESVFAYDLTKDKRYTVDKFQFHVPITLNFKGKGGGNINQMVREYLHEADDTYVIGIDRGERNLLYLVVVDSMGHICEQVSLNEICNTHNGTTHKTDYHNLLTKREHDRLKERQSWQTIEGIKELKEGYLSQIIHKIAKLMIKYRAIVVLENLNGGFMRGRQKVERSVYQKFEKMLIDKLNYLVDKNADPTIPGGLLKAYQLTEKFESFKKLGKQSGFLFYVPAWNTSKIDPATGFVNLLDLRYESVDKAKQLLGKFNFMRYNEANGLFEFGVDYNKFTSKATGTQTMWTICTNGTRIENFRNPEKNSQWDHREIDLTAEFKTLFASEGIDLRGDLKEAIIQNDSKPFFERLLHLMRLTLQMRNSITGTDVDYIISPVANDRGEFFDSRQADNSMPQDADANGAYNIARKGLMIIEQLKSTDAPKDLKFDLSNKRWLQFAQQKR